ncbi:aspartate kinase [Caldibacillus lycopersici]|uniref:Aspartokinase n=1 Tax=Perspicuibacillus lycopersici TaxID=1325689 RepID=A0AAE3ITK2_9BACI|nr:aspartate kinase [Perspicuibacillus lycopersici]MCU9614137.1 aspartate kinase [Perspicuibacillus lycopersici]
MGIIVQKFGGTSVGSIERIRNVTDRIVEEMSKGNQVVTVVSAMGKSTDELVGLAKQISATPAKRELDMLLATGEQVTISLLTMALIERGLPAVSLTGWQAGIQTESVHGNARILHIDTKRISNELAEGRIVIVAGFQGATVDNQITTLGRGGSDTTAVAIASALQAERCDIYTDVTGVYTADPRFVKGARQLPAISYDEMLELANLGAGVLHPRAVEYAKNYQIPLVVRSSMERKDGTYVLEEAIMEQNLVVRGVAFEKDTTKMTVFGMKNGLSSLSTIFTPLAKNHINVDIIIQSYTDNKENNVSFSVKSEDKQAVLNVLEEQKEMIQYDHIDWEDKLAKVSIVGSGMISNPGVAALMFDSLASQGIMIKMVSTSEIKVSAVVDESEMIKAAQILHTAFHLDEVLETVSVGK